MLPDEFPPLGLLERLWRPILTANRYIGNYDNVIWLVGDGRSGTTWVANLINYHGRYRQMFEPFHPLITPQLSFEKSWLYIRPNNHDHHLARFASAVFQGKLQHHRVDCFNPKRILYNGLLIKDIFTHLFVKWVDVEFPNVRKILLLRHPCAIAASKENLKSWSWMEEPQHFLSQRYLYEDYLYAFEDTIRNARSYFERQITIWCVLHYVVFRQLNRNRIHLVFYEELCTNFDNESQLLLSYLGDNQCESSPAPALVALSRRPSQMTRKDSAINTGLDLIAAWRRMVTDAQIDRANEILSTFGLDGIYDQDGRPNREAAESLLQLHQPVDLQP